MVAPLDGSPNMTKMNRFTSSPTEPSTAINDVDVIPTAAIVKAPYAHRVHTFGIGMPNAAATPIYAADVSTAMMAISPHLTSSVLNREILTGSANRYTGPSSAGTKPSIESTSELTRMLPVNPASNNSSA
jgi:hypothetical protein